MRASFMEVLVYLYIFYLNTENLRKTEKFYGPELFVIRKLYCNTVLEISILSPVLTLIFFFLQIILTVVIRIILFK